MANLTADAASALRLSLAALGKSGDFQLKPLTGGLNNRVFEVSLPGSEPLVLKHYFAAPEDNRNRLATEYRFLRVLWDEGIRAVPEPVAEIAAQQMALYGFVAGQGVRLGQVSQNEVSQALAFLLDLSKVSRKVGSGAFNAASDACFSLNDHIASMERRIARVQDISDSTAIERDAKRFLREEILPLAETLKADIESLAFQLDISGQTCIAAECRCLSPSDFGFHNALRKDDGSLVFLDFEYAGYDDPAKMICDFFSQEAVQVPAKYFRRFADGIADALSLGDNDRTRIDRLLPVHRLKWACMILQEFVPAVIERRRFAMADFDQEAYLAGRLYRARELMTQIEVA